MFKVISLDGIDEEGLAPIRQRSDIHLDVVKGKFNEDELCELIKGYNAVLIRSASTMTKKVIDSSECLQIIGRAGVGVDNVDVKAATKAGVFVCNSPLGNVIAAAEHSVGMIFSACRNIPFAHVSLSANGKWDRAKYVGLELKGRVLGLVGCGRVGSRVARILKAAGMSVIAFDPYLNKESANQQGIKMVATLEELFTKANIISLHLPKTPETTGVVNKKLMTLLPKNSVIVNVARGGIINEEDLAECLRSGAVRVAAIDVFDPEPVDVTTNPLFAEDLQDKVVLTPHLGASTLEAQLQVAIDVSEQVCSVVDGKTPVWAVNKCARVKLENGLEQDEVQPIYDLAEALANIAIQMKTGVNLVGLCVSLEGDVMLQKSGASSLVPYAAIGALKTMALSRVNIVNVEEACRDRCIELTFKEISHPTRSEATITLRFDDNTTVQVVGTVSTRIPGYIILRSICSTPCHMRLPTTSSGLLLYTLHEDRPGVLAAVTVALASRGINIADCHLARSESITDANLSPQRADKTSDKKAIALFYIADALSKENHAQTITDLSNDLFTALKSSGVNGLGVINLPEY